MPETARRIPFGRLAAEFVVIVVGVLVALGADAWWDDRQERAAERELLTALEFDLSYNLEVLDESRVVAQGSLAASESLLDETGPEARVEDPARLDSLLAASMWISSYDPRTGTLEQILRLDGLRLIRSEPLRRELSMWDEQLRDYREDESYAVQEAVRDFLPIVRARVPGFGLQDHPAWNGSTGPSVWMALMRDLEFANVVGEKVYRLGSLLYEFDDLEELIRRMLELTTTELSR